MIFYKAAFGHVGSFVVKKIIDHEKIPYVLAFAGLRHSYE
jgi:hypothetical protein